MAFHFNQGQHQVRLQAGPGGLPVYGLEQIQAFDRIGDEALQTAGHINQPDLGVKPVVKAVGIGDGGFEKAAQLCFLPALGNIAGLAKRAQAEQAQAGQQLLAPHGGKPFASTGNSLLHKG